MDALLNLWPQNGEELLITSAHSAKLMTTEMKQQGNLQLWVKGMTCADNKVQ